MDGLLNQGCLEIKNDCAIRHILGKSGDQRQLLPLDKVTHIRRELKAALAQLLAWRRRLHHGCRVLFTTEWSWQSEGINYGVNFPIPWGRGKWDMIQGRQLMVPRRPSASSPSSPHPFRRHHNKGSIYLHGCSAAEALLISIMTVKNKCVSRGEIHGLLGGLMDAGNEPLMRWVKLEYVAWLQHFRGPLSWHELSVRNQSAPGRHFCLSLINCIQPSAKDDLGQPIAVIYYDHILSVLHLPRLGAAFLY